MGNLVKGSKRLTGEEVNRLLLTGERNETITKMAWLADMLAGYTYRRHHHVGHDDMRAQAYLFLIELIDKIRVGVVVPENPGGWLSESLRLMLNRWAVEQRVVRVPQTALCEGYEPVGVHFDLFVEVRVIDPEPDETMDILHSSRLTEEEIKIVGWKLQEESNVEIAWRLSCTERTVINKVHAIRAKIEKRNIRANDPAFAARRSLVAANCCDTVDPRVSIGDHSFA